MTNLSSGFVLGSVIGPLLFVLHTNDIANLFNDGKCACKLYADDIKLYFILETVVDISYTCRTNSLTSMIDQTNGS